MRFCEERSLHITYQSKLLHGLFRVRRGSSQATLSDDSSQQRSDVSVRGGVERRVFAQGTKPVEDSEDQAMNRFLSHLLGDNVDPIVSEDSNPDKGSKQTKSRRTAISQTLQKRPYGHVISVL